jgi:hypothetical protein
MINLKQHSGCRDTQTNGTRHRDTRQKDRHHNGTKYTDTHTY